MRSILITQCLQNDFVKPIEKFEALPNLLHIGHSEALRLVGEDPSASPVNQVVGWAYRQKTENLELIHIRDWHDPTDPKQQDHLKHFGLHCIHDTPGANFIFDIPTSPRKAKVINSLTLNDFIDTDLGEYLQKLGSSPTRVGLVGVWTEAKITYLAYELRSRFANMEIAVCSALTASSTRAQHFAALNQLQRVLGVQVIDSVGDFVQFLGDDNFKFSRTIKNRPTLNILNTVAVAPTKEVENLIEYLFRDCQSVDLKTLDGGFSGNYVFGCESKDQNARDQVPHVLKLGPRQLIAKERTAYEQVEQLLGNSAPRIVDFVDGESFGGIKYRYASMNGSASISFQKMYIKGASIKDTERVVDQVFGSQLGRLYSAAQMESCNLFEHYGFRPDLADRVAELVSKITGQAATGPVIEFSPKKEIPNPAYFYQKYLPDFLNQSEQRYFSYVHGDLNGANIIIDANKNVWLIDFFHSHVGHVLKDLVKFENDLLYIWTAIKSERDLALATEFTDSLLAVKDLATIPTFSARIMTHPTLGRAARTVKILRKYYPRLIFADIDPVQAMVAQLRYSVHTLSFDEPSALQKRWALYAAGVTSSLLAERVKSSQNLRVDWIPLPVSHPAKLGITLLPGRLDRSRVLATDLQSLQSAGVNQVIALITNTELKNYGVSDLFKSYRSSGLVVQHVNLHDGAAPTIEVARKLVADIDAHLLAGQNVLLHCLGGLGRSGTLAACYLISHGLSAEQAIAEVRQARSPRAIETTEQEKFLHVFAKKVSKIKF